MSLDLALSLAAGVVEIGGPLLLLLAFWRRPAWRHRLVVVIGAVTPLVMSYAGAAITYAVDLDSPDNRFTMAATWVMTFVVFVACLVLGWLASPVPRPRHLAWRS